jgi:hypothetical protein
MTFWQQPCFYCGYAIFTIGLDRIDNQGYEMGKVVSCCQRCNQSKSDLSQAAFLEMCKNVALRHGLIRAQSL